MSEAEGITAVVLDGHARDEVMAAVERQMGPLDDVVDQGGLATAAEAVAAAPPGWDWLWLLDGTAVPAQDALERLRAPVPAGLPAPILLASEVTTPSGRPHPAALPEPELFEKEISIAACERRLVHVRAVRPGSLLVPARAVERFGPPLDSLAPPYDTLEWTARMLRSWDDPGFLVPASRAVRADDAASRPGASLGRARALLRGASWSPRERLWNGYGLALDAASRPSGSTRRSPSPSTSPRATTATLPRLKRLKRR